MSEFAGRWADYFVTASGTPIPVPEVLVSTEGGGLAALWVDRDRTAPLANPLPVGVPAGSPGVDARGNVILFADPDQYVVTVTVNGDVVYAGGIVVTGDPDELDGGGW